MLFVGLVTPLVLCAASSNAMGIWVRNVKGELVRPSWIRRHEPGELIRLPLKNIANKAYSTPVSLGTPVQEVQMGVSLSQNHVVVASSNESGVGYYSSSSSSTSSQSDQIVIVKDAGGHCIQAQFSQDELDIGQFAYRSSVAVTDPSVTGILYPDGVQGLVGYGVDGESDAPSGSSLLGAYTPAGIKDTEAISGIELNWDEEGIPGGILTMGGTDSTAYTGNFTEVPVTSKYTLRDRPSWTIPVDDISAEIQTTDKRTGKKSYKTGVLQGGFASFDPYYPFISIPSWSASQLYNEIPGAYPDTTRSVPTGGLNVGNSRYIVPCDTQVTLSVRVGGKDFPMAPRDSITREGDTCYGTVEVNDEGFYRVGSPFMRNVYTTFGASYDSQGTPSYKLAFADKNPRSTFEFATTGTAITTATGSTSTSTAT